MQKSLMVNNMIRQNRNSIKLKLVIFLVIYAALAIFSFSWYNTLTSINCDLTKPLPSNPVKTGSSEDATQNCSQDLHFHWIKFYGINGLIYGAPLLVLVINAKKGSRN